MRRGLLLLVLPAVVGVIFGKILAKYVIPPGTAKVDVVPMLVLLPVIILVVLAVHELGHLAGGRISGFRFAMFAVGPIFITREGTLKIRWNRSLALWGGIAAAVPVRHDNLNRAMGIYMAGGPLASMLLAVVLWGISARVEIRIMAAFSALIGIVTLIPMRSGGFLSDGARLLMLIRNGPQARRWSALAAVGACAYTMTRPRDWPRELIEQARSIPDASCDDLSAAWLDFRAALDSGDEQRAAAAIDYVWQHRQALPKMMAAAVEVDRTTFLSLYQRQPVGKAPEPTPLAEPHSIELAVAAVLLAEGKRKTAAEKAQVELQRMTEPVTGTGLMIRDLLREVVRQATA